MLTSVFENIGIDDLVVRLVTKYLNFLEETGGINVQLRNNKWHHRICET